MAWKKSLAASIERAAEVKAPTCRRLAHDVCSALPSPLRATASGVQTARMRLPMRLSRRSRARRGLAWVGLAASVLVWTTRVEASDFWDEVRNPGLFAHRAHLNKGLEALLANRSEQALTEAEAAIAQCEACADGHVLRARALAASGRHAEAVDGFERALGLRADALDTASDALAAALSAFRSDRPQFAASVLARALALNRDPATRGRALAMLADALQAQGPSELKRAIAAYAEAMRDDQARKRAMLGLALALHRAGELAQSLLLARRASESDSNAASDWLPEPERAARAALWSMAIGDQNAAAQAWQRAADGGGPWAEHARAARALSHREAGLP